MITIGYVTQLVVIILVGAVLVIGAYLFGGVLGRFIRRMLK